MSAFLGVISAAYSFFYLVGLSFEYGENLEIASVAIPILAFSGFALLNRMDRLPKVRRSLVDFTYASLLSYLALQFVVIRYL